MNSIWLVVKSSKSDTFHPFSTVEVLCQSVFNISEYQQQTRILIIKDLSGRNGHIISHKYSDFGQSGTKRDWENHNRMIEDGKKGKLSTLYVISIERLSRSVNDLIEVVETLNQNGVQIIFQREQIDTKRISKSGRKQHF